MSKLCIWKICQSTTCIGVRRNCVCKGQTAYFQITINNTQKMNEIWQIRASLKPVLLLLMRSMQHKIHTIHAFSYAIYTFKTLKIAFPHVIIGHVNGFSGWVKPSYFQGYRFTFSWCGIRISDNSSCSYIFIWFGISLA